LNDHQRVTLAYLRRNKKLTNGDYRRLNHVDTATATKDLRGLVRAKLCTQAGSGRWSSYELAVPVELVRHSSDSDEALILVFVREWGSITNLQTQELLGVSSRRAKTVLTRMRQLGLLELSGNGRYAHYRLGDNLL
jgi:predicted HTH transcriptional regulator